MSQDSNHLLRIESVSKSFQTPGSGEQLQILSDVSFELPKGETLAILGESGSGKSTLLGLIGGLDHVNQGQIEIVGKDITRFTEDQLADFRAQHLGIIFQRFHLMSHLNALENIALPLDLAGRSDAMATAKTYLEKVGLGHRGHHYPSQLSGGECQRVAIARALSVEPVLLLADEPTGNLDFKTSDSVSELLFELVEQSNSAMVLVTHDRELGDRCDRKISLKEGKLCSP